MGKQPSLSANTMTEEAAPAPTTEVAPGSMKDLYTFVPASMVEESFKELAQTWPTWESVAGRR